MAPQSPASTSRHHALAGSSSWSSGGAVVVIGNSMPATDGRHRAPAARRHGWPSTLPAQRRRVNRYGNRVEDASPLSSTERNMAEEASERRARGGRSIADGTV